MPTLEDRCLGNLYPTRNETSLVEAHEALMEGLTSDDRERQALVCTGLPSVDSQSGRRLRGNDITIFSFGGQGMSAKSNDFVKLAGISIRCQLGASIVDNSPGLNASRV